MKKTTYYSTQLISSWEIDSIIDSETTEPKDYFIIDFEKRKVYSADEMTIGQFRKVKEDVLKEDTEKKQFAIVKNYSYDIEEEE